jgi:hypothetical protein
MWQNLSGEAGSRRQEEQVDQESRNRDQPVCGIAHPYLGLTRAAAHRQPSIRIIPFLADHRFGGNEDRRHRSRAL